MKLGIIGKGAIGTYVRNHVAMQGHSVSALLIRDASGYHANAKPGEPTQVDRAEALPGDIELMIDCGGHAALRAHAPEILARGTDLITVSLGALADQPLEKLLEQSARDGQSKLYLASGAIGALDCLRAARTDGLRCVTYTGRKPPAGWIGSPAEQQLDLDAMNGLAAAHFEGTARLAATRYPKNANVAAAVALAGIGFDQTNVSLIADPAVTENIHEIKAEGDFGSFTFEIRGRSLPDNPRSSALAAMSVLATLDQRCRRVVFSLKLDDLINALRVSEAAFKI